MTTNCIQKPKQTYKLNIFTTGTVGWPGVTHVNKNNLKPLIDKALALPGYTEDKPDMNVLVGFGHDAVLGVADKIVSGVKDGSIGHFFLVGGCDGVKKSRNYYTEFVEKTPDNSIVLTLACGKFKFFKKQLGDINGIPRLLDVLVKNYNIKPISTPEEDLKKILG